VQARVQAERVLGKPQCRQVAGENGGSAGVEVQWQAGEVETVWRWQVVIEETHGRNLRTIERGRLLIYSAMSVMLSADIVRVARRRVRTQPLRRVKRRYGDGDVHEKPISRARARCYTRGDYAICYAFDERAEAI